VKFALGTAQFGMTYGIANRSGQIDFDMAGSILDCARRNGIHAIDTAIGYADSEAVLGRLGIADMRVITKLSELPVDVDDVHGWVIDQIDASLKRLRIEKLAAVLLHRPMQLLGPQGAALAKALQDLKTSGRVEKIGVSIYDPEEMSAFQRVCPIDLVQAPLNLVDRRLVASGWLKRLKQANVEVHVRSLFLQGLLLMAPTNRPSRFARWGGMWQLWDDWIAEHHDVGALAGCIAFAQRHESIDHMIVGVDSDAQLDELILAANQEVSVQLPDISSLDDDLINPARWSAS
jgi:aryl-alcohol dehydrogenase-like predicted oxidoreductase